VEEGTIPRWPRFPFITHRFYQPLPVLFVPSEKQQHMSDYFLAVTASAVWTRNQLKLVELSIEIPMSRKELGCVMVWYHW